jgi:site-specific DNA-adenine methylase
MATSVQTTQRKRRYTEDDLKHLPRDGYKLRELFAGGGG